MKEKFRFYYEEPDFKELWANCIFIFDTNILLNLYRYPKETSEDLIRKLENDISNRLWMPHQIAIEYLEGRDGRIKEQNDFYERLINKITIANNEFNSKLESEKLFAKDHYFLKPGKLANDLKVEVKVVCNEFKTKIDEEKAKNHDFLRDDIIRDRLDKLFNNSKLGNKFSLKRFNEIIEEGRLRYTMKIPPGHGDGKKESPERYNDLIIWYQIIEYAKVEQTSIIFVTEDTKKEDWFKKNIVIPRNNLIQEFYDKTEGQLIYIYNFKQFMDKSEEYLKIKYENKTKEDVEQIEDYIDSDIMSDVNFKEINKAFLDNFKDCNVINRTIDIDVEFKHETDAEWFYKNICYPKGLEKDEYPVGMISSMSPIGDPKHIATSVYSISFVVNDKDKLINMLYSRGENMKEWKKCPKCDFEGLMLSVGRMGSSKKIYVCPNPNCKNQFEE